MTTGGVVLLGLSTTKKTSSRKNWGSGPTPGAGENLKGKMQKELVTTECSKSRVQTAEGKVLTFAGLKKKHEPKSFWFKPCGFFICSPFMLFFWDQKKRVMKSEENTFSNAAWKNRNSGVPSLGC